MEISPFVDERRDPVLATQAAAEYFKGLYSVFGSWYLAMASYNVGENRVKREVMNHYTRDFWELARKKRLPAETINYVPKFIAAKLIGKDPAKYGFGEIDYLPPIEFDHITISKAVNLRQISDKLNLNYEDFKALNPKFKGEVATPKGSGLTLRIPPGTSEAALIAANESVVENVQFIADSGDVQVYRVRRGDSLGSIARRYRTTVAYLRDLNDLPRRKAMRVGMKLYVPDRTPLKERSKSVVASNKTNTSTVVANQSADSRYYVVQSGDSLFTIARKYSTSVSELQRLNNMKRGKTLKVGMKLKVPSPDNSSSAREVYKAKFHVVRRGENLSAIAAKYKVSAADIQQKNKIRNPGSLLVGTRFLSPSNESKQ